MSGLAFAQVETVPLIGNRAISEYLRRPRDDQMVFFVLIASNGMLAMSTKRSVCLEGVLEAMPFAAKCQPNVIRAGQGETRGTGALKGHEVSGEKLNQEPALHQAEGKLGEWDRRQAAIVTFGEAVFGDAGLSELFDLAVRLLADALAVEYVKILERIPGRSALRLRAGIGWENSLVGVGLVESGGWSQAGYTLRNGAAVVVTDLTAEKRFKPNGLLAEHGVVSGLSVLIPGESTAWGILGAHCSERRSFSSSDVNCFQAMAHALGAVIRCKQAETMLRQARDSERQLREDAERYARKVFTAQEAERRRIARELHDEMGQVLTGLTMMLERIEQLSAGPAATMASEARGQAAALLNKVHDLSLDLRPPMLDDFGLLPSLLWLARRYEQQTGVTVELHHEGQACRLPAGIETAAYRLVQEALTNVARHAGVGRCTVSCEFMKRNLLIAIRDHGSGFAVGSFTGGLAGMQERVRLLGGYLRVTSAPGQGTLVAARYPITGGGEDPWCSDLSS